MKTLLAVVLVFFATTVTAEVIDTKNESITVSREIDTISIMPSENFAVIQIKKTYLLEGVPVIGIKRLEFRNIEDNPDTEEDETDTSYTDLMGTITINKQALKQLIKNKL